MKNKILDLSDCPPVVPRGDDPDDDYGHMISDRIYFEMNEAAILWFLDIVTKIKE